MYARCTLYTLMHVNLQSVPCALSVSSKMMFLNLWVCITVNVYIKLYTNYILETQLKKTMHRTLESTNTLLHKPK